MFKFLSLILSVLIVRTLTLGACVDIEANPQDFILELKRIEIPGYPHAFNPSIIRWKGCLLMSFWLVKEAMQETAHSAGESHVGLVWLDDDFNPVGDPYFLDFGPKASWAQDVRLINVGETLYMVYSDVVDEVVTDGAFRMWTAKLDFDGCAFRIYDRQALVYFDGESPLRREKNWVPFDYEGQLHLAYSLTPHRIFQPFERTGCCHTVAVTRAHVRWRWGDLRGGTPAVKIDGKYLAFFHSCVSFPSKHSGGRVVPHYMIGAYTFSKDPPFEITCISSKPIIARGFYSGHTYPYYWKPVCVVFPCGILIEDEFIWVSYGRQDHELWVAKIDRAGLLKSLVPVKQKPDQTSCDGP